MKRSLSIRRELQAELDGLTHVRRMERQAAALAWKPGTRPIRFVLVTSRRTGRWVFPKGGIDPGMKGPAAAAQEALEEAGVVGRPAARPIGHYHTLKIRPPEYWDVKVSLYPLKIRKVLDTWDEIEDRERRFVTLKEARDLIEDEAMLELAKRFVKREE